MDLFGDLPEPGDNKSTNTSLYDNLPTKADSSTPWSSNNTSLSLYDDIPTQSTAKTTQSSPEATAKNTQSMPKITQTTHKKTQSVSKDLTSGTLAAQSQEVNSGKHKLEEENCSEVLHKKQKQDIVYEIDSYIVERQGEREDMQDAHLIIQDLTSDIPNLHPSVYRVSLFGVFDGHGGTRASRFASENLHKNLRDKFPKGDITVVEKEIRKAFIDAFKKTDDDFLKLATKSKPVWKDGTTAILVLLINETMYIANIGDSQAVLCRYKEDVKTCVAVPLSVAHNPSLYDERMRIQKQGGHVKDGRVMGVLEVSRSIGDGQYKKLGVTCTPDVKKCSLTDNDRYVIIACDGLWKCFEPADSIEFTNKILQNNPTSSKETENSIKNNKYESACNKLANEAVLRFSGDNVTVLLLAIRKCR